MCRSACFFSLLILSITSSLLKNRRFLEERSDLRHEVSPYSFASPAFLSNHPLFSTSLTVSDNLESSQTLQIQEPSDHERLLPDVLKHSPEESPESMFFFGFSPQLLNLFPGSLAQLVEHPSLSHSDPRMLFVRPDLFGGNMGLYLSSEETLDKLLLKESFVGPKGFWLYFQSFLGSGQELQDSVPLSGSTLRTFNTDTDDDSISVLHDGVAGVRGDRGLFGRLRSQSAVGVGGRAVGLIGARLAAPVNSGVSRVVVFGGFDRFFFWLGRSADGFLVLFWRLINFDGSKAFVGSVRSHGRAVDAPVGRDQPFFQGDLYRVVKESLQNSGLIKTVFSVLRKGGGVPYGGVNVQPHEPSESHVALKFHHKLPVRPDSQEISSQKSQEQLFGRNRGTPVVFAVEGGAKLTDSFGVNKRTDFSKRVIFGDKVADLNRMKHSFLRVRASHHRLLPSVLSVINFMMGLFYHVLRGVFQQTASYYF